MSSFKNRIESFWQDFIVQETKIRKMMDEQKNEDLIPFVSQMLKNTFLNIAFEMGIDSNKKYELILSSSGNKNMYYLTDYWKQSAPKQLENWTFHSAKPVHNNLNFSIQIGSKMVSYTDVVVYPYFSHETNKVDIEVFCKAFKSLDKNNEQNLLFLLLDAAIGETTTMYYIGGINILRKPKLMKKPITLDKLLPFMNNSLGTKMKNTQSPYENNYVYEIAPSENKKLRYDIISGFTTNMNLINEYYSNETICLELMKKNNATYGFLFFDNSSLDCATIVSSRGVWEDKISECMAEKGICSIIGGATGKKNSYIDLIIFDFDEFIDLLPTVFAGFSIADLYFSTFMQNDIITKINI